MAGPFGSIPFGRLVAGVLRARWARIGPTRTVTIDVPAAGGPAELWQVEMHPGGASVGIDSTGEGVVQGTIAYNMDGLKPVVTVAERSVRIHQDFAGVQRRRMRNEWRLRLGRGVPMSLKVYAGVSRNDWDLGGLSLRRLDWVQGIGRAAVTFSEPNPEPLERVTITGATAALTVRGLANANLDLARVYAGLGAITLVFDGRARRDAGVVVNGGVSSIAIGSGGNPVRVVLESEATTIDGSAWSRSGNVYSSPECDGATGPKVTVRARLGLSALRLMTGG
ncbi:MAG TPA: hypothetical protein VGL15_10865 [Vicinamibacteria bacterium]|jgi:hypothetical protein